MSTNANALAVVDGFDDTGDNTASPLRGIGVRFKDGSYADIRSRSRHTTGPSWSSM